MGLNLVCAIPERLQVVCAFPTPSVIASSAAREDSKDLVHLRVLKLAAIDCINIFFALPSCPIMVSYEGEHHLGQDN